jgi:putative flippase GtrA
MKRVLSFSLIGILNSVFSYTLFVALLFLDVYYLVASTVSYLAGVILSYILNSNYTFEVKKNVQSYVKFSLVSISSLLFGLGCLYVFKEYFEIHEMIGQVLIIFIRFPYTYFLLKYLVFKKR